MYVVSYNAGPLWCSNGTGLARMLPTFTRFSECPAHSALQLLFFECSNLAQVQKTVWPDLRLISLRKRRKPHSLYPLQAIPTHPLRTVIRYNQHWCTSISAFYHRQHYSLHTMPLIRTQSFIFHENGSWNEPSMLSTPPTPNPPSPGTGTYTAASTVMLATTQHVTTTVSGPATSGSVIPTLALAPLSISPALPIPGLPIVNQGFPRRSSPLGPRPRVLSHHPAFPRSGPKPNLYRLALMIRLAKAAAKNPSAGPVRARILSLPNVSACQAETEYPSFGSYSWFGESHQD